jgi:hypothetical protein
MTPTEINLVFRDWLDNFAPAGFIESEHNVTLLADYIRDHRQGIVTTTTLNQTAETLRDQLEFAPPPKVKTAAEIAEEGNAKMRADYMKSIAPQESFDDKVARDKQTRLAVEAAKAQADAKGLIALAISGYQCYKTNGSGVDYPSSEMVQRELGTVKFGDYVHTLAAVQQIIQELPDHPKLGDVARVAQRLNARAKK